MSEYEYICKECKIEFSIFLSIKEMEEKPEIKCFHCGCDKVEREYSSFFANTESES
jgi:putative FmdB family regulatory protein